MDHFSWTVNALFLADLAIRLGLSARIIMRRLPIGVSLAWLAVVMGFPFAGTLLYLLFGGTRLGWRRARRAKQIHGPYLQWLSELHTRYPAVDWAQLRPECQRIARLTEAAVAIPALSGNSLRLLAGADEFFPALIADIEAAQRTCHLEFYIWNAGGKADAVADALLRAVARGVSCRLLVDALGSHSFLHSEQAEQLRKGGVSLRVALPIELLRLLFVRADVRLHRKIVVIDGELAYTGSLNLVDPALFKQDAGVGQWVDAMVRLEGPAVEALAITFLEDWELETGEGVEQLRRIGDVHTLSSRDSTAVQVIPSGPATSGDPVSPIILSAIFAARRELVLTTPYFVPDEALLDALTAAARRGVEVTLIVPERIDSTSVRYASRAPQRDLLAAGVRVALFQNGLLHTKSISVDGEFSFFGSLNLDLRSMRLNFEITLAIYDAGFTAVLRGLQDSYIKQSRWLDQEMVAARSSLERFAENTARLLSPLL